MGGDYAPAAVVNGASLALKRYPNLRFKLYGDEMLVRPLLAKHPALLERSDIIHTDQIVAAHAKPSAALRQSTKSSMRLAIDAVKSGEASGVISSGNTGALLAMAKVVLRTLPNITRPAITSTVPTERSRTVMLDMGANIDCDEQILFEFAVMGDAFARILLGIASPSIGLLNVGEEEVKGHDTLKLAYQKLKATPSLNFHGFIEGNDILKGTVDVVVTDGFTGNVALKTIEGTAKFLASSLKEAFSNSLLSKLGYLLARASLTPFREKMDPRKYNGGVFIGVNGIVVKSHGNADAEAFANAIVITVELITHDINGKISSELSNTRLTANETESHTEIRVVE